MGTFIFILIIATFGLPAGIFYMLIEMLLNYTRDKATREKIKKAVPRFQDGWTDKASPSFPDLQKTVGGKMSGGAQQSASGSAAGKNGEQKVPSYTYKSNGTYVNTSGTTAGTAKINNGPYKAEPYARMVRKPRKSFLTTAAAATLFGISGITLLSVLFDVFDGISAGGVDPISYADQIPVLLISIVCLIAGIWLIYSKKRKYDRENRYIAIINQGYGMIPIDNISYLFPEKYDKCVQDLQEMINRGVLPGAYIDYGRRLLVIDPNNSSVEPLISQNHDGSRDSQSVGAQGAEAAKPKASGKKVSEQKIDFLSLERLSKQVKDEDIKMKLIRISTTMKTIGQKAEEEPDIRRDAGVETFMEMYIPKTIKLVEDYEEVNSLSNMPANNELKQNILETLDAIDDAAMSLWKDIIHSDMIDISSELEALQNKLILDGYKKSELEPDAMPKRFDFNDMDISEEQPAGGEHAHTSDAGEKARDALVTAETRAEEAEARRRKQQEEAEKAVQQAEDDAVRAAKEAEDKDAAMEADLFSKLRAQQEKEKELLK